MSLKKTVCIYISSVALSYSYKYYANIYMYNWKLYNSTKYKCTLYTTGWSWFSFVNSCGSAQLLPFFTVAYNL